jgi:hypothetical protein
MVRLLREFISTHKDTKGCYMRVKEYKEKELPSTRGIQKFDTIRIEFVSLYGVQIDCFTKPDELLELGELFISAYNNHIKDKQKGVSGNSSHG